MRASTSCVYGKLHAGTYYIVLLKSYDIVESASSWTMKKLLMCELMYTHPNFPSFPLALSQHMIKVQRGKRHRFEMILRTRHTPSRRPNKQTSIYRNPFAYLAFQCLATVVLTRMIFYFFVSTTLALNPSVEEQVRVPL